MPDVARNKVLAERSGRGVRCSESSLSVTVWDQGIVASSASTLYRVTGCGADYVVACHTSIRRGGGVICSSAPVCITEGCDSFELAARNGFVDAFSCPVERVAAAPHAAPAPEPPPSPPADIASDPERLRIWTRNNGPPPQPGAGLTFFSVRGCGHETTYGCRHVVGFDHGFNDSGEARPLKGTVPVCERGDRFFPAETR
jgi:hypothetical protein